MTKEKKILVCAECGLPAKESFNDNTKEWEYSCSNMLCDNISIGINPFLSENGFVHEIIKW